MLLLCHGKRHKILTPLKEVINHSDPCVLDTIDVDSSSAPTYNMDLYAFEPKEKYDFVVSAGCPVGVNLEVAFYRKIHDDLLKKGGSFYMSFIRNTDDVKTMTGKDLDQVIMSEKFTKRDAQKAKRINDDAFNAMLQEGYSRKEATNYFNPPDTSLSKYMSKESVIFIMPHGLFQLIGPFNNTFVEFKAK